MLSQRFTEVIVFSGYPFNIIHNKDGIATPETMMLRQLRPGIVKKCLPSIHHLGGQYLEGFCTRTFHTLNESIRRALEAS